MKQIQTNENDSLFETARSFSYEAVREEILSGLPVLSEASQEQLKVSDELYQKLVSWNACEQDHLCEKKYRIGDDITMKLGDRYTAEVKAAPLTSH